MSRSILAISVGLFVATAGCAVGAEGTDEAGASQSAPLKTVRSALVEIDGVPVGGVHKVDVVSAGEPVVHYQAGLVAEVRPGRNKPGQITIVRDWSSTKEFSKATPKSISIVFHDDSGEEAGRINLSGLSAMSATTAPTRTTDTEEITKVKFSFQKIETKN